MTDRVYPGAVWAPCNITGTPGESGNGQMRQLDSATFHEAVTTAEYSVKGWNDTATACQAFNGRYGSLEQNFYIDQIVWGVKDGNGHRCTVESWDGLIEARGEVDVNGKGPNETTWTDQQAERFADFAAWLHLEWGVPLRVMANSNPSETGFAPHRTGILPWRTGSESWTAHDGKPCPGDLRVAQLPGIIARAQDIADHIAAGKCTYLPPGDVDLNFAYARTIDVDPIHHDADLWELIMTMPDAPPTWAQARKDIANEVAKMLAADPKSVERAVAVSVNRINHAQNYDGTRVGK